MPANARARKAAGGHAPALGCDGQPAAGVHGPACKPGRLARRARVRRDSCSSGLAPALLDRMARRETRFTPCGRCARTVSASQMLKRALHARGHAPCAARRRICRCRRTPAHGFARCTGVFVDVGVGGAARWAVPGGGDLWDGGKRSGTRGSPDPKGPDRREAMRQWRVQRRCERHRSRPCGASIAAKSAQCADRHSRSPCRVLPTAPLDNALAFHHHANPIFFFRSWSTQMRE